MDIPESVLASVHAKCDALLTLWDDDIVTIAGGEIGQAIVNFTNRAAVPDALYGTWADMIVDFVMWVHAGRETSPNAAQESDETVSVGGLTVSSISEGSVSVALRDKAAQSAQATAGTAHVMHGALDTLVMDYAARLREFRVVPL